MKRNPFKPSKRKQSKTGKAITANVPDGAIAIDENGQIVEAEWDDKEAYKIHLKKFGISKTF